MHPATYQKILEDCQKQLHKADHSCSRITFWRGITSACAILIFCIGCSQKNPVLYAVSAAALAAFLLLVRRHSQIKEKLDELNSRKSVLEDYLARYGDGWKNFSITGERYFHDSFQEAADLDIFGRNSLYQYICTASTVQGQDLLAGWLSLQEKDPVQIRKRQQAAVELAEKHSFCLEFETAARRLRNISYADAQKTIEHLLHSKDCRPRFRPLCKAAALIFPVVTLIFLLLFMLGFQRSLFLSGFSVLTSLQLLLCLAAYQKNNRLLVPIYRMNQSVMPYQKLLKALEEETFTCDYLKQLQNTLTKNGSACTALKELEAITESVVIRKNLFAFILYSALFFYDFRCVERYLQWKEKYQDSIKTWLEAAGTAETLISLCVISRVKEVHTMPDIKADALHPVFSAEGLRHPLLKESDAVGNDFELTHRTCVITGSNMSGKTTFLRSIGVNLILAYAGGFCTAKSLAVSPMELCTSMRVQDDVSEGISTFYAELLRIKRMTDIGKKQAPMIALIDEIYKGTNSKDRIFAAKETVKKLSQPLAFTILTTHDFELCELENSRETDAENYYFEEHYEQNQILFDYKIKKGRSTTSNARYLLRMAGIIPND